MRRFGRPAARVILALAVCASLWWPHYCHFQLDRRPVPMAMAESLRLKPADAVLDEVGAMRFGIELAAARERPEALARRILEGELPAPEFLDRALPLRGHPEDYRRGPVTFQLFMAGLGTESILLDAYEKHQDRRLLELALKRTVQFADWEARQRMASDFLWNDHAIAARIAVLARLWRHVRGTGLASSETQESLLSLVERSGQLLAAPDHFTVRTNHGVMQNVALLQIGAAFPDLPRAPDWQALAIKRLQLQLGYYVSAEGVVLEHSPEYHALGGELLAFATRLAAMNGLTVPPSLAKAANATQNILASLVRPDGTLPLIGNTTTRHLEGYIEVAPDGSQPLRKTPLASRAPRSLTLPLSGYSIWWNGTGAQPTSQTVVTWARHEGHGHKHADETSLTFWSHGSNWISNVGYWPYGAAGFEQANGWPGSNAPHAVGEPANSARTNRLLGTAIGAELKLVDTVRSTPAGASYRRQIVQRDADTLLVIDQMASQRGGAELAWTAEPGLVLVDAGAGRYNGSRPGLDRRLQLLVDPGPRGSLQLRRGSLEPFGGWMVGRDGPTAATSVHVAVPAGDSIVLSLIRTGGVADGAPLVAERQVADAEHWVVEIGGTGTRERVRRDGQQLSWLRDDQLATVTIEPPPDITAAAAQLRSSYRTAVSKYPQWRDLSHYRLRAIIGLVIAALVAELGWAVLATRLRPGVATAGHYAILLGWIGIAWYAHAIYLT